MNRDTLRGFTVSAAVSAAVSFGMLHVASIAPSAHASAAEARLPAGESRPAADGVPRSSSGGSSGDSAAIADAPRDGAYAYWIAEQHAMP